MPLSPASAPSGSGADTDKDLFTSSYGVFSMEELLSETGPHPEWNVARPVEDVTLELTPNGEYLTLHGSEASGQKRIGALKELTDEEL